MSLQLIPLKNFRTRCKDMKEKLKSAHSPPSKSFIFAKRKPERHISINTNIMTTGKKINIFGDTNSGLPAVYIHTFREEGRQIRKDCDNLGCRQHVLVEIAGDDWNDDMTPWPCGQLFKGEPPYNGKAREWLKVLTEQIIPVVEHGANTGRRYIAGYSLAGLFALWALYNTDAFSGALSASGSLWYPGFLEYALSHEFCKKPDAVYLSLGDREHLGRIKAFRTVRDKTESFEKYLLGKGIATAFEINPGNHFSNPTLRMAKGIKWMLDKAK